jgi:hypothetical protein
MSVKKLSKLLAYFNGILDTIQKENHVNLDKYRKTLEKDVTKIIVKKKDLVKKSDTAYRIFAREYTEKLKGKQPNLSFSDITKKVSAKWKGYEDKERYEELAKADKCRYLTEIVQLDECEDKKELMEKNHIHKIRETYDTDYFYDLERNQLEFFANCFIHTETFEDLDNSSLIDFIMEKQEDEEYFVLNEKTCTKKHLLLISRFFGIYDIDSIQKNKKQDILQMIVDIQKEYNEIVEEEEVEDPIENNEEEEEDPVENNEEEEEDPVENNEEVEEDPIEEEEEVKEVCSSQQIQQTNEEKNNIRFSIELPKSPLSVRMKKCRK